MKKERERRQVSFEVDKGLQNRLRKVARSIQGATIADIGRAALNEKLSELETRIAEGQKVTITI